MSTPKKTAPEFSANDVLPKHWPTSTTKEPQPFGWSAQDWQFYLDDRLSLGEYKQPYESNSCDELCHDRLLPSK